MSLGPVTANIGATLAYQIDLSNPGDLAAKEVMAAVDVPDGLTYINSNPAAETAGRQLRWRLGDLGARQRLPVQLSLRAEKPGSAVICCDATAAGGLKAGDCATTTVAVAAAPPVAGPSPSGPPAAGLSPSGPPAAPGTTLAVLIASPPKPRRPSATSWKFIFSVSNYGQTTISGGVIRVRFDPGLVYEKAGVKIENLIQHQLPDLRAGETRPLAMVVRVVRAGRASLSVEVAVPGIAPASAQAVVTAVGGAAPSAPPRGKSVVGDDNRSRKTAGRGRHGAIHHRREEHGRSGIAERASRRSLRPAAGPGERDGGMEDRRQIARVEHRQLACRAGGSVRRGMQVPGGFARSVQSRHRRIARWRPNGERGFRRNSPARETAWPAGSAADRSHATYEVGRRGIALAGDWVSESGAARRAVDLRDSADQQRQRHVSSGRHYGKSPDGLMPIALGTVGASIDGQAIRFDPIAELPPGKTQTYRVRMLAKQPGTYHLRLELTTSDPSAQTSGDSDEVEVRS